jgi:hypothetical protein
MKKIIMRKIKKKWGEKLSKVSLIEYNLSNDKTWKKLEELRM